MGGQEISYPELVKQNSKGHKITSNEEDEDTKANKIAQYFEQKYATGKKRRHIRDLIDGGEGYDNTDPFVDDSECYNELLPYNMVPSGGGFYINRGKLELVQASDASTFEEDDSTDIPFSEKSRKRKLLDSESDEDKQGNTIKKHKKKIISVSSDESNEKPTSMKLDMKTIKLKPSLSKKKGEHARILVEKARLSTMKDSKKTKKKITIPNVEVKNNLLKKAVKFNTISPKNDQQKDFSLQQLNSHTLGVLPTSIQQNVLSLKEKCSKVNPKEGKQKFFSPEINKVLLETELLVESKQIKGKSKNFLYNYISDFFPCSKETLVKRMKKLVVDQQEGQLKPLIAKLKEAVEKDMIVQEKEYKDLCENMHAKNGTNPNQPASFAIGSPENENDVNNQNTSLNEEKSKRKPYAPRRKFTWSKSTRTALCEVVHMKIKLVEQNRGRSTVTAVEYLKDFFENELKNLWPKGWMQIRQLMKESKIAHQHLTVEFVVLILQH